MSGEGGQPQPKAAPKAPTITSAFINKGAKTFAPKKPVRRRPVAAAATKPVVSLTSTPTPTPTVEQDLQTPPQVQADPALAVDQSASQPDPTPTAEQQTTVQLATPAATQEPPRQDVPQIEQTAPGPPAIVSGSSIPDPTIEPLPTPDPTNDIAIPQPEVSAISSAQPAPRSDTLPVPTTENESGRSPKRRRLESPEENETRQTEPDAVVIEPVRTAQEEPIHETPRAAVIVTEQHAEENAEHAAHVIQATEDADQTTEMPSGVSIVPLQAPAETAPAREQHVVSDGVPAAQATPGPIGGERIWNTVNNAGDNGEGPVVATANSRKPTGRRRRKPVTLRNLEEEEEGEVATTQEVGDAEDDFVPPRTKRPSAKPRGTRTAAQVSVDEEDGSVQPPPKKKRQPRKAKAKNPATAEAGQNIEPGQEDENEQSIESRQTVENDESNAEAVRPKPARKRKRQTTSQPDGAAEGEQDEQQPRRRGRPPRQPTPPDAEDEVIDEDIFFMDDLARRNIRIGRLSQREKKMREINWEEVKQRQREKEAEQMNSRAVHAEMERQAQEKENEVRTVQEQVRYENINGEMRIVQGSGQVNYEAIAETRYTETVIEEDDFTNRITSRSFMRNNKRYPEEFLLPGQGQRWDIRKTADFYDALRMFGTDFGMMTTLFEGVSRRSLKLKFNREERKNPEIIKEIMQHKDTRLKNWDEFLKVSGKESEQYDRVDQIKMDLEAAEEDARRQIEEAKAEYEEEKRQRRLAGFVSDEEGGENDGGKKKKGKKGKEKHVTFQQDEDGVEILEVDDNDGWGEE